MLLDKLIEMSRRYGGDPDYVLAGGGNTSFKDGDVLYVKASGYALKEIDASGFAKMDRNALAEIWNKTYSENADEREAQVLAALTAAKCADSLDKRPSVETLLHNLLPQKYVLHLHPALVNGLTCSADGEKTVRELFPYAVWTENAEPGYILAKRVKEDIAVCEARTGKRVNTVFLKNHGIIFAADTVEEIDEIVRGVMETIEKRAKYIPDLSEVEFNADKAALLAPALRMLVKEGKNSYVTFKTNGMIAGFVENEQAFSEVDGSFTPDHIVYCKSKYLFVKSSDDMEVQYDLLQKSVKEFISANGFAPRIVAVEGLGFFACGSSVKEAYTASDLFTDACKIGVYARNFGGSEFMPGWFADFISNWEAENYRKKTSVGTASNGRLDGKIAIVTGGAQGFGKGIAEYLIKEGAVVMIADLNGEGAEAAAREFNAVYGENRASWIKANVTDETDSNAMAAEMCLKWGGIDLFVNNAGIVRSGPIEQLDLASFDLVTKINYHAYFLGVKYASKYMKIQHRFNGDWTGDIVQVNSKSGLEGSNKNFAYAGSKFGGIGLTQSFALELVEYNIKVNSVCPGNFFDGPLWMDPVKGLFVTYLKAGKVPGAVTVEDVKKFYEAKIPMHRGCTPPDVAKAILYCVEQQYETGQAIPVTGGQVMLK